MKAAVLSYQDFVDDSISGSSPEGGLAAQLRLVRELGGDEELARRIVTTHAKHQIRLNDIHSALENLSMVYYFGEEAFTDRDTRLHRVAEKIFKHWIFHARSNVYKTLTRGKLDVPSIVGHWRARNKHWQAQLPRKATYAQILFTVQQLFDHAASIASRLYDEDGKYCGPGYHGRWEDLPRDLVDDRRLYTWEVDNRWLQCDTPRTTLSIVTEEPSIGDDELPDDSPEEATGESDTES
ncbi:hypothetical protein CLAFUW4_05206 [Fulvia fulva]|uniref:Uncharacterized protein n=1 Tax=Passalora fulva TaxID=5499 RepID=A0A9Q8PIP8_PASFU|nr:uncharacterized protein CLAFUR5_11700 [Fulvia fulva]KAK4626917.1 hypothetical protein CLAFUR4_05192 [Fulvia fulva]KAK4628569.1 hypothetical protein CLAFUR0_05198 [Fulvia fulva]UJO23271.1 hypothetical protein CLAFUR5_11700 [Fulvia fulva]WPV13260.1 hypothetical protein CLAFUW4_05206 [Fulvia fulva]WPV29251.1 hypothetical protein CLAFUW7_05202 [Fulvia fulva]